MKVKKYVAPTMNEAREKIKKELGHDAIILNSKVIHKGGFLGFFTKKFVEVIAAIDNEVKAKPRQNQKVVQQNRTLDVQMPHTNLAMVEEMKELRNVIHSLSHQMLDVSHYPKELQPFYETLCNQEVLPSYIQHIMQQCMKQSGEDRHFLSADDALEWTKKVIYDDLKQVSFGGIHFNKKYLALVGPTGVGKTTTLAKIAAISSLQHAKRVAMITTDTYRIAAVEQLRTYAQILNIPIEVAYNLDDFKQAKEKFTHYDLVLIDTAGRNFRDPNYVSELKTMIHFDEEMETYLVLAVTSKFVDMKKVYEQFSDLIRIDKIIFTKIDETETIGAVYNFVKTYKKGISYLTVGQNVPDDIVEASPSFIIKKLLEVERA